MKPVRAIKKPPILGDYNLGSEVGSRKSVRQGRDSLLFLERPGFGIVPTAFGKLTRDEVLRVWGDGSAERDYLYIGDFTRLVLAALDAPPQVGFRVFNACNGGSIDLNALFARIEQVTGRTLRCTYDASRPVDAPSVRMQATRARETFGWTAEVGLEEGLERTWRWFSTSPH